MLSAAAAARSGDRRHDTKLKAIHATEVGIETVIIRGQKPQMLYDVVEGTIYQTRFGLCRRDSHGRQLCHPL